MTPADHARWIAHARAVLAGTAPPEPTAPNDGTLDLGATEPSSTDEGE